MPSDLVWSKLQELRDNALSAIASASDENALTTLQKKYLGKKGEVQAYMQHMKELSAEERPKLGALVNEVRDRIEARFAETEKKLADARLMADLKLRHEDLSLPGRIPNRGAEHPLQETQREIEDIFLSMGFEIARGPQSEWDYFNFEALNFPADHPARDMQDTLMLENGSLLRTHTSPVQVRTMLCYEPPIRIIAPGTVYRRDDDVTHSPVFHQIEGLHIEKGLNLTHLRGILQLFAQSMFGKDTKIRLRPSFFPFTEPSVEVDIACIFCHQKGCRMCKGCGWIEILGAGMVDPNVLREGHIDPEVWSGWAFGVGIERVAMLLHGITDIRLFFESDLRFLSQFRV
ncbi:MAG: phenylalanine--tRNA ligase subunit alpha [Proteobacteria bacterium]|nr:phenylalanine--tRNA ligase subunit alpha [Pseudomonadota bacterium]